MNTPPDDSSPSTQSFIYTADQSAGPMIAKLSATNDLTIYVGDMYVVVKANGEVIAPSLEAASEAAKVYVTTMCTQFKQLFEQHRQAGRDELNEALEKSAAEVSQLHGLLSGAWQNILILLGAYRDQMPADAVTAFQEIANILREISTNPRTGTDRLSKLRELLRNPPHHHYWGAGEPDCPPDLKASNGELWQLRCKVCGETNPRETICQTAVDNALI